MTKPTETERLAALERQSAARAIARQSFVNGVFVRAFSRLSFGEN